MPFRHTITHSAQSTESEIEDRRARGQLSCAECRRLKLKCDKKVPCSSCKRRRCEGICPNGVLKTVHDSKQDKLHQRIMSMSKRIQQLEDALQAERSSHSTSSLAHPLLTDDLLAIKNSGFIFDNSDVQEKSGNSSLVDSNAQKQEEEEEEENIVTSLGFLSVSEGGETQYVGQSGFQQIVFLAEEEEEEVTRDDASQDARSKVFDATFPPELKHARDMWPFVPPLSSSPKTLQNFQDLLEAQLPEYERAISLVDGFLMKYSWSFRPADREQLVDDLIPRAYQRGLGTNPGSEPDANAEHIDPHDLALLFMIFSCGSRAESAPARMENHESVLYYELACASLGLKSVLHNTSLSTVQAISLVGIFELTMKNNLESAWKICSLALAAAVSIGLHRDPARWKIEQKLIQRRRLLFWEMYVNCSWVCLCSGRPLMISPDVADCGFPIDTGSTVSEDGIVVPSFIRWKHMFMRDVIAHIIQRLCTSRPLKYSEILKLDRRIQEFDKLPTPYPRNGIPPDLPLDAPSETLQWLCSLIFKDMGIMYIHRALFARALLDYPKNPLRSPFAPSFIAAYRSATSLLKVIRENFDHYPHLFMRTWLLWTHAFSSSIIVGSVVSRAPSSELAAGAFFELGHAITIFQKAPGHPIAKQGLPILLRVYNKAHRAFYGQRSVSPRAPDPAATEQEAADNDDELSLLSGVTRTMLRKSSHMRSRENSTPTVDTANIAGSSAPWITDAGNLQSETDQYQTHIQHGEDVPVYQTQPYASLPQEINAPLKHHPQNPYPAHVVDGLTTPASQVNAGSAQVMIDQAQAQALNYIPWNSNQSSTSAPFGNILPLDGVGAADHSAYFDMNIDVSDVNFDLSSLLSSGEPTPWPSTTNTPAPTDGFGILPATPPPFQNNVLPHDFVQKAPSTEVLHPGDEIMEAWRSLYMRAGLTPNAMQSDSLAGDQNAAGVWSGYGFMGASQS